MTDIVYFYKPIGMCLSEFMDLVKETIGSNRKYAFMGRLDPMACGILGIRINPSSGHLAGDLAASVFKTYQFNLIESVTTESGDILGIPRHSVTDLDLDRIRNCTEQKYPIYSSFRVDSPVGKIQMWKMLKLNYELPSEENWPRRAVKIDYINLNKTTVYTRDNFINNILKPRFDALSTDSRVNFNVTEISEYWTSILPETIIVHSLEASVSPGTYIRTIAKDLGGTALDICRVKFGDVTLQKNYDKFVFTSID